MTAMLTRNTERVRDALIASIIVKTMPEMLRKLIPTKKNPFFIGHLYRNNKDKYHKALNLSEKERGILSTVGTDGFDKCDTPLLYKLIKYFNFVGAPTKGWGKLNNELKNTGDVVEAIIRLRDEIVEHPREDFQDRVNKMVKIAKVVDKTLSSGPKFENAVKPTAVEEFDKICSENSKVAFQLIIKGEGHVAKYASEDTELKEHEKNSCDEDIFTNFLHTKIRLSPALFTKAGKNPESKLKQIKELAEKLCKTGATCSKVGEKQSKDGRSVSQGYSFTILDVSNESLKSKKTKKRKWTASVA